MPSRRDLIKMTRDERRAFVREAKTATLVTNGKDGYPHAVAMWFYSDDDDVVWMTTYRKSQKVANLRRDPKAAIHVESGVTYETLKGVLLRGDIEIVDDAERVLETLTRITEKMTDSTIENVDEGMRLMASKRIVMKFTPVKFASWDHTKLGGRY
jgi:PPOX class probable F420-dependent enzyme